MSIEVNRNVVVVDQYCEIYKLRNAVDNDFFKPIVVHQQENQTYSVFFLAHLIAELQDLYDSPFDDSIYWMPLYEMDSFLDTYLTEAIDIQTDTSLSKLRKGASTQPMEAYVVTESGDVVGLFEATSGTDRTDLPSTDYSLLRVRTDMADDRGGGSSEESSGVLSAKEVEPRIANFELLNSDWEEQDPNERALKAGDEYYLALYIDNAIADTAFLSERAADVEAALAKSDDEFLTFQVKLTSDDFDIEDGEQELEIPRAGRSDQLDFTITPKADGEGQINVVFLKDNAFVQVINLRFQIGGDAAGAGVSSSTRGVPLADATAIAGRNVNMMILSAGDGFQVIMTGPVAARGNVKLTRAQLGQMIAKLRKTFLDEVVMLKHNNVFIYQRTDPKIPKGINDRVLKVMAEAGQNFFNEVFGIMQESSVRSIGKALKAMAAEEQLKIQVVSDDFTLPWGLLYVGDDVENPDPEMFLGMKHIIEHIPLQDSMSVISPVVDAGDNFQIGLNLNRTIDEDTKLDLVAQQEKFWAELAAKSDKIEKDVRESVPKMMKKINDPDLNQDFLYFYCHAESKGIDEGGMGESRLLMTGNKPITLNKMMRADEPLKGNPLVFLNACESAEMSPEFYGGFVRYFTQKGARGVIGTEALTPAGFARDFAKEFFLQFLKGEKSVGQIFLDLRRNYYFEYNNIMGLIYALYVDADTVLSDPVI